jgi:hypothetical protein
MKAGFRDWLLKVQHLTCSAPAIYLLKFEMPSNSSKQVSGEEAIAKVRKVHLIGRFKVSLSQTQNHPDQRALDQAWVDELVKLIGSLEVLNRALHPISVILEDDSWAKRLQHLLEKHRHEVPDLPMEVSVLVFAGQHRLAMLSQLGLDGSDQLWWHADVYKQGKWEGVSNKA